MNKKLLAVLGVVVLGLSALVALNTDYKSVVVSNPDGTFNTHLTTVSVAGIINYASTDVNSTISIEFGDTVVFSAQITPRFEIGRPSNLGGLSLKTEVIFLQHGNYYDKIVRTPDFVLYYNTNLRGISFGSYRSINSGYWRGINFPLELNRKYTIEVSYSGFGEPIVFIDGQRVEMVCDEEPEGIVLREYEEFSLTSAVGSIIKLISLDIKYN